MKVKVAQSCSLCDPKDYTVNGILQVRILEWVAYPFPRDRLAILQENLLTQELNWGLLNYRQILYQLSYPGSTPMLGFSYAIIERRVFS